MSILAHYLQQGQSMPQDRRLRHRLALRLGRWLARRHGDVQIDPTARISPEARVNARSDRIRIGADCSLAMGAVVQGQVSLGRRCSVQCYSVVVGYGEAGRVVIGDGVRIAPQVMLIAADHVFQDATRMIHQQGLRPRPIVIEDDVWLAGRVVVTAGVTIGRGSVIGAGAVVTRDVPAYSVAVGVPARVIAERS